MENVFDYIPNRRNGKELDHWHYAGDYSKVIAFYGFGSEQESVTIELPAHIC